MAGNTVATLNGFFKDVFAPEIKFLMPRNTVFQRDITYISQGGRTGELHSQPVVVKHEHGFTYGEPGSGEQTLDPTAAGATKEAQVVGYNITLRSSMSIEAASRAAAGGKQAFMRANVYLVEAMTRAMRKRNEIDLINGQANIGVVAAVNSNVLTISDASWAAGIWSGMEGAKVEIFDADLATKENSSTEFATVTAVDLDAKTVTLDADPGSTDIGDVIYFKTQLVAGSPATNHSQVGVHKILTNTGLLYNIDASAFSLWKANSVSAGGPLTYEVIQKAQARAVEKGAEDDMKLYCSPLAWKDLIGDLSALREYNKDDGNMTYTLGASQIVFYGQVGKVTIAPSIYVKEGFAYLIPPRLWNRIGSTDVTFRLPGRGDEFFEFLENANAYQLRCYANTTAFTRCPGQSTVITGIVNAA